jgi:hypothetical protein
MSRNKGGRGYRTKQAQEKYEQRRLSCGMKVKIYDELESLVNTTTLRRSQPRSNIRVVKRL